MIANFKTEKSERIRLSNSFDLNTYFEEGG